MKKVILILPIVLVGMIVFSFGLVNDEIDEVKITVTAENETLFDMVAYPNVSKFEALDPESRKSIKDVMSLSKKGLKTPYEFTVNSSSHFIFKSQDQKTRIKVNADRGKVVLSNELPIVVILLNGEGGSTFGID